MCFFADNLKSLYGCCSIQSCDRRVAFIKILGTAAIVSKKILGITDQYGILYTMELYDHIRKISFLFFVIIGLVHFLSGLFFINNYFIPASGLVNRILFIPFVVSTLTYGLSNFKYHLLEYGKDSKTWNYAFLTFGAIIFITLLAIELLIPDSQTPLIHP